MITFILALTEVMASDASLIGDSERKRSMSITPLCDRFSTTVAKIQTGLLLNTIKIMLKLLFSMID